MNQHSRLDNLDTLYQQVVDIILARQHPVTGLMPASTAVTVHGDYQDAWVRDNVYSVVCVWALSLACRRQGQLQRQDRLAQATIKLMRGLLQSMMRQSHKVERFKHTQNPLDALHAKFDTASGLAVVADDAWGHLQLDATSLFLLMVAQMTQSGLRIIMTQDEVDFVQNLIYYISTAYRTPDYGIWERGNKINNGKTEVNASSLGMAKSALLALDGLNLFGPGGPDEAVVHVIGDAISHARSTLATLLPRESLSKEVDAALLSVIGFPAFAVGDPDLVYRTRREILEKLAGNYGCKRFLLDGHQTVVEDTSRIHYEHSELVNFEHIESEWPLFFCYLFLNALFDGDGQKAARYRERLESIAVERDGVLLLPELYYVPADSIEAEKAVPHSQPRLPNDNLPLIWAQSLFLTGILLQEGHIAPDDLDPLGIRKRRTRFNDTQMALVVLAETDRVKQQLASAGVIAETLAEIRPYRIISAPYLVEVYRQVGANPALGLSGRPQRSLQSLSSSQTSLINQEPFLCLSWIQSREDDYRLHDAKLVTQMLRREIRYILKHWFYPEVAVFTFLVTESLAHTEAAEDLYDALRGLQLRTENVKVGYASANLAWRASRTNTIAVPGLCVAPYYTRRWQEPAEESRRKHQMRLRRIAREPMPQLLRESLEELQSEGQGVCSEALLQEALKSQNWWLARHCHAALVNTQQEVIEAMTWIIARHINLVFGRERGRAVVIDSYHNDEHAHQRVLGLLATPIERALVYEILIYLGALVRTEPEFFEGLRTIEIHSLLEELLQSHEWRESMKPREVIDRLGVLSPGALYGRLCELLSNQRALYRREVETDFTVAGPDAVVGPASGRGAGTAIPLGSRAVDTDWLAWRHARGLLPRFDKHFLKAIWQSLGQCPGIEFSDAAVRDTTLVSELVRGSMTPGEETFAQLLDRLVGLVHPPYYRTACIEALGALAECCSRHPEARFPEMLRLAELLEASAEDFVKENRLDENQERALDILLEYPPEVLKRYLTKALNRSMIRTDAED